MKNNEAKNKDNFDDDETDTSQKLNLYDIIENIDDLSEQAENMKISKNQFMECLRQITKQKIMSIKEAKGLFTKRIKKLIDAQKYELQTTESKGIMTA